MLLMLIKNHTLQISGLESNSKMRTDREVGGIGHRGRWARRSYVKDITTSPCMLTPAS